MVIWDVNTWGGGVKYKTFLYYFWNSSICLQWFQNEKFKDKKNYVCVDKSALSDSLGLEF